MGRHYSVREVFRQMPNALLARYFGARALLNQVDFSTISETQPEQLLGAWLSLPDRERTETDAELREVFELSSEKGFRAIIDEAEFHHQADSAQRDEFVAKLASLSNHFERAMVTFLEHRQLWRGATHFFHADTLPYWRKRKNLPRARAAVDTASLAGLATLIGDYFHRKEGRGKNCVVEPFRRGERDYFFAYPEDYSQQSVEWVDGEFDRRPHNPAFEVVYVYSQAEGTLDVNCRGSYQAIEPLQGMFATAILKLSALPPDPKDCRVYDLNPLRHRQFGFVYALGSGIEDVAVKKIRLSSTIRKCERITIESDPRDGAASIYDQLENIGKGVSLELYHVTQVELAASVATRDGQRRTTTIRITHPNSCSLKYDDVDLRLRDMLRESGIEPKPRREDARDSELLEAAEG